MPFSLPAHAGHHFWLRSRPPATADRIPCFHEHAVTLLRATQLPALPLALPGHRSLNYVRRLHHHSAESSLAHGCLVLHGVVTYWGFLPAAALTWAPHAVRRCLAPCRSSIDYPAPALQQPFPSAGSPAMNRGRQRGSSISSPRGTLDCKRAGSTTFPLEKDRDNPAESTIPAKPFAR